MSWTTKVAAGAAVAATLIVSGCAEPDVDTTPSPTPTVDPDVTLTVSFVGDIGLEPLAQQYMDEHDNVTIELASTSYASLHDSLQQSLVAGEGAPTIAVVDEAYMPGFVGQSDGFVNLLELGASEYESQVLPWAWGEATNANGSATIGMPATVSGLALCYRRDLVEAAGLPGDRDELSTLMGDSWEGLIEVGQQYVAASGRNFLDNASSVLNPILMQEGVSYFDADNALAMGPVEAPYATATAVAGAGISANIAQWSAEWDAALSDGTFAAVLCPSWMTSYIASTVADDFDGQWDVMDIPGEGGNWAGNFYTIPAQADEATTQAAYEFIQWLMEDEQQLAMFQSVGTFPSRPALYEDSGVQAYASEFFNGAPVGAIFTKTAADLTPSVYYAMDNLTVRTAVELVLAQTAVGSVTVEDSWAKAVEAAEAAAAS